MPKNAPNPPLRVLHGYRGIRGRKPLRRIGSPSLKSPFEGGAARWAARRGMYALSNRRFLSKERAFLSADMFLLNTPPRFVAPSAHESSFRSVAPASTRPARAHANLVESRVADHGRSTLRTNPLLHPVLPYGPIQSHRSHTSHTIAALVIWGPDHAVVLCRLVRRAVEFHSWIIL